MSIGKYWWRSKTFWAMVLTVVFTLLATAAKQGDIPARLLPYLDALQGVAIALGLWSARLGAETPIRGMGEKLAENRRKAADRQVDRRLGGP